MLREFQSLKKVIIMEHIPSFDTKRNTYLSQLANSYLNSCVKNSPLSQNIIVGNHCLDSFGAGKTHQRRYVNSVSGLYDGVLLQGPNGCQDLTMNMINILNKGLQNVVNVSRNVQKRSITSSVLDVEKVQSIPISNRFEVLSTQGN